MLKVTINEKTVAEK